MRKRKKSNCIFKKTGYWIIGLLAVLIIGFEAYRMVASWLIERKADKEWPTRDLTSGSYSGDYDGIDISKHQGRIHWDELSQVKKLQFIFIKATEGADIKDPSYDKNINQARKHGIPVGSYHFLSKAPAPLQFENFRNVVDKDKQDLLPVIDAEDEEIQSSLKTLCHLFKAYYGHTPIIYCSESYYKDYLAPDFNGYYLWIASYNHEPVLPGAPHYDIWQFHRHGRVPGIWNWVDLNKFADDRSLEDIKFN